MRNEKILIEIYGDDIEGVLAPQDIKDIKSAMDLSREDEAVRFAEWINKTNWAEKETWGKHDPPSMPTTQQLYQLFKTETIL